MKLWVKWRDCLYRRRDYRHVVLHFVSRAALSRLIFSFSRDRMLPGSEWMAKISKNGVPDNAMVVSCLLPVIICVWVYFQPDNLSRITAFAVIGIYISFQMVVLAALRQRLKGWKPMGSGPLAVGA